MTLEVKCMWNSKLNIGANFSMPITRERIDECADCVISNPDIAETLKVIKGEDTDKDELHKFVSKIIESIILEKLVERKENKEKSDQGKNYVAKKEKVDYEFDASKIKWKSFKIGIEEFFYRIDYKFNEKEALLNSMLKQCKNYKFYETNIINDYSILFFSFKMFDVYCQLVFNCNDSENPNKKNTKQEIADLFSEITHNQLKKKYKRKHVIKETIENKTGCRTTYKTTYKTRPVHVSENVLVPFCKKFPFDEHRYVYTLVFISFIQTLANSTKLDDWIRYNFFCRFYRHIILFNAIVKEQKPKNKKTTIVYHNFAKTIKSISNKLQYLKKKNEDNKVAEIEKIRELFKNIPKNQSELERISKKKFRECCHKVFDYLNDPDNYENNAFSEIIPMYMFLPFETDEGCISYAELIFGELGKELPNSLRFLKNEFDKNNIYVNLLIPSPKCQLNKKELKTEVNSGTFLRTAFNQSQHYKAICDKMISDINKYVEKLFCPDSIDEFEKQYKKAVGNVKFNPMDVPILSFDVSNYALNDSIKALALFVK